MMMGAFSVAEKEYTGMQGEGTSPFVVPALEADS
jgi:hypothetical protein